MKRINLIAVFVLLTLFASVLGATACTINNPPSVTIGNYAAVCLTVQYTDGSAANSSYYYVYKIKIDQFTSLKLNNLTSLLQNKSANSAILTIQFQNQPIGTEFLILSNTSTSKLQRSVISTVINTVNGAYSSIANDIFCDSSCGNCFNGECFDVFSNYTSPDLKVYISWAGSDSSNSQYLSQSQRLSRFNLYSVSSLYSSVKNTNS